MSPENGLHLSLSSLRIQKGELEDELRDQTSKKFTTFCKLLKIIGAVDISW